MMASQGETVVFGNRSDKKRNSPEVVCMVVDGYSQKATMFTDGTEAAENRIELGTLFIHFYKSGLRPSRSWSTVSMGIVIDPLLEIAFPAALPVSNRATPGSAPTPD